MTVAAVEGVRIERDYAARGELVADDRDRPSAVTESARPTTGTLTTLSCT